MPKKKKTPLDNWIINGGTQGGDSEYSPSQPSQAPATAHGGATRAGAGRPRHDSRTTLMPPPQPKNAPQRSASLDM